MTKKCEHGRRRTVCKDCKTLGIGGASICEHNRRRSKCKECGGSQICEHNRIQIRCRECGGSQICEHNRRRYDCSVCKPDSTYKQYKRGAEQRGLSFLITLDDFKKITAEPCFFCGEYELPNCRPCCGPHNRSKGEMYGPDFIELCLNVADHVRAVEAANDAFLQQEQTV
jgi:hypothetical protein